jgi:hypothetical protein
MNFVHPSTWLISGPTGCGKTRFVQNLLLGKQINPHPDKLIWVYSEWQPAYDEILSKAPIRVVKFQKTFSRTDYDSLGKNQKNIIVLDDQMGGGGGGEEKDEFQNLFTRGSHHRNLTVIYIVQNLFDKSRQHRTISLNVQYMVLFKNPRDMAQIEFLGRQVAPGDKHFLSSAYRYGSALSSKSLTSAQNKTEN